MIRSLLHDNKSRKMKRLPTLIISCVALNLTALNFCDAGHSSRFSQRRKCVQPTARVCSWQPVCQLASVTHAAAAEQVVIHGNEDASFVPDDLNVQMTAEIASLREELEQLKLANAEKDEALQESTEQFEQLADAKLRAKQAEVKANAQLGELKKENETLQESLAKARQNNNRLRKQLDTSKEALTKVTEELAKARAALSAEQEKNQKEQPRPEEKAIETPPAKEETSTPPEEPDSEKSESPDGNADEAAEKIEPEQSGDAKTTDE